jgi:hypothetical protein
MVRRSARVNSASPSLRIAVLIGAEAYQAHHVADIAWHLAERPGVEVELVSSLPATFDELDWLARDDRDRSIPRRLLKTPAWVAALQRLSVLGTLKTHVMRDKRNVALLAGYDAIVTPTDHAGILRSALSPRTAMIYVNHGIGGRAASYSDKYLKFDFVVVANRKDEERLLDAGMIRPGHYIVAGYPKFEAAERLARRRKPLFRNDRPVVLFNPHSKRALRSWERFARPLIEHAARTSKFNLIVAPHVKLFNRRPRFVWRQWERLAVPDRVIVDLGSSRSLDMTYTSAAHIYVGDVSSQLYEFLGRPKPCVFLNAHKLQWRGNPGFPNWDLGDVVETPDQAIGAIRNARSRHSLYQAKQASRIAEAIDRTPGAASRAADAIVAFLRSRA